MLSFIFLTLLTVRSNAQSAAYGGGIGFTGSTTCVSGFSCVYSNDWFSQCVPSTAIPPTLSTSRITTTTSSKTTLTTVKSTSTTSTSSSPTSTASGKTKFAGVNIAGFDFGCTTDGACDLAQTKDPTAVGGYLNGHVIIEQMKHFATDDHLNMFRLPVGWQYLSSTPGGTLDSAHFARYDSLVQGCLATGAYCIIDIHNYARWNGAIIGQGGPTNAQFANTWSQIAKKYASQSRVGFGIMNEPHDVPDSTAWAATVQAAVTAIRSAGATTQLILLPGNNWTSAQTFISSGSAAALSTVKNLDGSTTNLIYDVHKYLDSDNSGTHSECVTNNIDSSFAPLATYLRANGRQAILSETGGGNVSSCQTYLCQQLAYLNANSDVYIGYTTWSAGEFDATWNYILTEVPTYNNGVWIDQPLVKSCVAR